MYGNNYLIKRLFYICFDLKCYWVQFVVMAGAMIYSGVMAAKSAADAKKAQDRADEAFRETIQVANKKMQYAAELDTEWKETFGESTAKAAKYYNNLTSENLKQQYQMAGDQAKLQNYQNFENQMKQLDTKINQIGMQNSSQALSALMQMSVQQMQTDAAINFEIIMNKMRADEEVVQKQAAWSAQGNTLKNAAIQTKNEAYNLQAQAWQAKAGNEQAQAINHQNQSTQHTNNAFSTAGDMASLYTKNMQIGAQMQQNNLNNSLAYLQSDFNARTAGLSRDSSEYQQLYAENERNKANTILSSGLSKPSWKTGLGL